MYEKRSMSMTLSQIKNEIKNTISRCFLKTSLKKEIEDHSQFNHYISLGINRFVFDTYSVHSFPNVFPNSSSSRETRHLKTSANIIQHIKNPTGPAIVCIHVLCGKKFAKRWWIRNTPISGIKANVYDGWRTYAYGPVLISLWELRMVSSNVKNFPSVL